jgi:DNA-binding beta-propeller fold protein YncE
LLITNYFSNEFSYNTLAYVKSYGIIDLKTKEIISKKLFDSKYETEIETPYGIAVNPITEDLYITDAGNYVSTGSPTVSTKTEPSNGRPKVEISRHILPFYINKH